MTGEGARCLFCGGDLSEPEHWRHCDGRQGEIEAEDLPLLISGLTDATYATSAAAAVSVIDSKDTQRELVRLTIRAGGRLGHSDDEVQVITGLDGSSERPRRWELWKQGRIRVLHDAEGREVKRLTRTQRRAVVWVCSDEAASER
jgi:hypothetical protein